MPPLATSPPVRCRRRCRGRRRPSKSSPSAIGSSCGWMTKYGFASGAVNSSNRNLFESRASRRMTSACPVATLTSSDSPALSRRTRRRSFPVSKGHLLVLGHSRRQSLPLSPKTVCVDQAIEPTTNQTSSTNSKDSPTHDQEHRAPRNNRRKLATLPVVTATETKWCPQSLRQSVFVRPSLNEAVLLARSLGPRLRARGLRGAAEDRPRIGR